LPDTLGFRGFVLKHLDDLGIQTAMVPLRLSFEDATDGVWEIFHISALIVFGELADEVKLLRMREHQRSERHRLFRPRYACRVRRERRL
jgi:hypothetical protein